MNRLLYILLVCSSSLCLYGQDSGVLLDKEIAVDTNCEALESLVLSLENPDFPDWDLPYQVTIYDSIQGESFYYEMSESTLTIVDIEPGEYEIIIFLDDDCLTSFDIMLEPVDVEDLLTETVTADCEEDGSITIDWNDLPDPKSILWSDGNTSTERSGLTHGQYVADITTGEGCTFRREYTIEESIPISFGNAPRITHTSSCITSDGNIYFWSLPSGGTHPHTYEWSNGSTSINNDNLSAGVYTLTVTDAKGCQKEQSYEITGAGQPIIAHTEVQGTCEGYAKGFIEIYAVASVGPMKIEWDDGTSLISSGTTFLERRSDLPVGEYCYKMTDLGNGCFVERCETVSIISDFDELVIGSIVKNDCSNGNIGSITANPIRGVGEYTFLWSTGATTKKIENLGAGSYWVRVTDDCGNTKTKSFTLINNNNDIQVESHVKCISEITGFGTIDLEVTGSTGPFSYWWGPDAAFQSTPNINVYNEGIYTVQITDKNGCKYIESFDVSSTPGDLDVIIAFDEKTECQDKLIVEATAVVAGGVPPFSYSWEETNNNNIHPPNEQSFTLVKFINSDRLQEHGYRVTVTDACGYSVTDAQQEITCTDFCDESDCFIFRWEDEGNDCIDFCDDALTLGVIEWECDQLFIEPQCDDGVRRTVFIHSATGGGGFATPIFVGKELVNGDDEIDINTNSPSVPTIFIRNEVTGCISELSVTLPIAGGPCFNFWDWVFDTFPGGPGGTNNCTKWTKSVEGCITTHICESDPSLNFTEEKGLKKCVAARNEEGQDDQGNPIVWHVQQRYCPKDCSLFGPFVIVESEVPSDMINCFDCNNFQPPAEDPDCKKEVLSIIYNTNSNSFYGFSKAGKTKILVHEFSSDEEAELRDTISLLIDELDLLDMKLYDDVEVLSLFITNSKTTVVKFDNLVKKTSWSFHLDDSKYISSKILSDHIIVTTKDNTGSYKKSSFTKEGNIISEIISVSRSFSCINGESQINQTGREYTLLNFKGSYNINLEVNSNLHSFYELDEDRYLIFYNYEKSNSTKGGKFGFGYLIYNIENQTYKINNLGYKYSSAIKKISHDNKLTFALGISYSINDEGDLDSFIENEDNCFEYVFLNVDESTSSRSQAEILTKKIEIFPSPTTGTFNINLVGYDSDLESVRLYDSKGNLVLEQKLIDLKSINITDSKYNSGVYYIEIILSNSEIQYEKIVKI